MFIAAVALAQLLSVCAPNAGRRTMAAIVRVESGGFPLAIHDNDLKKTFEPTDVNQGVVWANQLLALHHSVDLGISQINAINLPRLGLSVRDAFDPCMNLRGGATILAADYRVAASEFGTGQFALRRAIGAYNSGSIYSGSSYIHRILEAAGIDGDEGFVIPDLQATPQALTANQLRPPSRPPLRRSQASATVARPPSPFVAPLLVALPTVEASSNTADGAPSSVPTPIVLRFSGGNPQESPLIATTPVAVLEPAPTRPTTRASTSSATPSPTPNATSH